MKVVSLNTACMASQVNYHVPVQNRYASTSQGMVLNKTGKLRYGTPINYNDLCFRDRWRAYVSAPTIDELHEWIQEKYGNFVSVFPDETHSSEPKTFSFVVMLINGEILYTQTGISDYYLAFDAGLERAIKLHVH